MNRVQPKTSGLHSSKYYQLILQLGILFAFLFFFPSSGLSQAYTLNFQSFDVEDGLLHRNVTSIFEDNDGIIWVGSKRGLQRFDGHDFKSWTTKTAPLGKVDHITSIGQDQDGWLWIWNNHLLEFVFLHTKTEKILSQKERFGTDFPIKMNKNGKGSGWKSSQQLISDAKGRLYFLSSSPNELIVYDSKKGFSRFPLAFLKSNNILLNIIDSQDIIWITETLTSSILYGIDTTGKVINKYESKHNHNIISFSEVNDVKYSTVATSKDFLYYKIDQSGDQILITEKKIKPKQPTYLNDFTWDYYKDNILIYTEFEVAKPIFDLKFEDIPKQFTSNTNKPFKDSKGRYWFSSNWGLGLAIIEPNLFKKYFYFENDFEKPINNSARGIIVEKDTIYANFEFGGLVSIPLKSPDKWTIIERSKPNETYFGRPLTKAASGGFYVGYTANVIYQIDPESNLKTKLSFLKNDKIGPKAVWSLYTDSDKKLWIGMDEGIAYKNPNEDHLHFIQSSNSLMRADLIHHICPDKNGALWFSGLKGLYHFDSETNSFLAKYGNLESENYHLPVGYFYYLYIDPSGIFWLGTNEGLLRWDRRTNEQRLFTTIDGLSNDVIYAIFEDDNNNLWLSSDYGIMQFDKETFHVNAFLEKDGIAHQEFNRISAFKEKDGTIYFGGLNGITAFHPSDFLQINQPNSSPMLISDFEIYDGQSGELLNKVGILRTTNTIDFHPNDRFFRLTFSLPIFENAKKINYAWQVEGIDRDWNYQKENTIQIGKLPYGSHILRVKGQSDNGNWSPHELAIRVNVLKPVYLQIWFIALSVLSFILLAFAFFNWRTKRLKYRQDILENEIQKATNKIGKQAEELKQLDKVKSRFFANVSHELRTPLTLMLGPISSVLKNDKLDNKDFSHLKKVQQNGKELLKLVASILNLSKLESGKLELKENSELLFPLIRRLSAAFESHAEKKGIQFSFIYKAEKDLQLKLDKGKLEIIINNLLSNAFKFSQSEGQVIISVVDRNNAIKISIEDKGRGIHEMDLPHVFDRFYQSTQKDAPTEGGTGIGLALCQELVKVMKGKIWVESEWGLGSTFFVELPRKEILRMAKPQETPCTEEAEQTSTGPILIPKKEIQIDENIQRPIILIVEDNHSLRDYLNTILEPFYRIWTAENGLVASNLLKENQQFLPSLILSDIMMPIMDGFQLLELLKSQEHFRHLPVIMLTARADIQDKIKALRIGVDDYLLKPFEEDELLARVENILNNYQERLIAQKIYAEEQESSKQDSSQSQPLKKAIPIFSVENTEWLKELEIHLKQNLSNSKYSISQLSFDVAISERQLRRRIKILTGLSPSQYLKETRLQAARQLLEQRRFNTVAQTAGAVGYQDPGSFSRNFSNRFGKMPSEYLIE